MTDLHFDVSLPTDDGFLGRECNSLECSRYFKVHADSLRDEMHCPYCNQRFGRNDLFTRDQIAYVQEVASEQALEYASRELAKMFGRVTSGSKFLTFKAASPYTARSPQPSYTERKVDSEIRCPECGSRFQVDGIFAHCVGCGLANIAVFDANLEVIRAEVKDATDPQRALRHAYTDLVSMFEAICADRARALDGEHGSFQDPYEARRFFKKQANVDILAGLGPDERLVVRRVFHKRHAWHHNRGVITERYVKKVPEDRRLEGQTASLSMSEFEAGAFAVRIMLDDLPAKAH